MAALEFLKNKLTVPLLVSCGRARRSRTQSWPLRAIGVPIRERSLLMKVSKVQQLCLLAPALGYFSTTIQATAGDVRGARGTQHDRPE